MKVNNGQGKIILKKYYKYLPKDYVYRPKQGWVLLKNGQMPLKEWSEELLFGNNIRDQNYFSIDKVKIIWDEHLHKKVDNTKILWPILMFQSWLNFYN